MMNEIQWLDVCNPSRMNYNSKQDERVENDQHYLNGVGSAGGTSVLNGVVTDDLRCFSKGLRGSGMVAEGVPGDDARDDGVPRRLQRVEGTNR